jgi:aspartate-semialdehyde dehydrogenase
MSLRLAIAGATGEVGRAVLDELDDASIELGALYLLASESSCEETRMYANRPVLIESLAAFDFRLVDVLVLALPEDLAKATLLRAKKEGCRVICYSEIVDSPVWQESQDDWLTSSVVRCPNPVAYLMAPLLNGLGDAISSFSATVMQPASSLGRSGVKELAGQTGELLNARGIEPNIFPVQVAFNCLPFVGFSAAEKASKALKNDMDAMLLRAIPYHFSIMQLPVFYGTVVALTVHTPSMLGLDDLSEKCRQLGYLIENKVESGEFLSPASGLTGRSGQYVTEINLLPTGLSGFYVSLMADGLRSCSAKATVDIICKWKKHLKY